MQIQDLKSSNRKYKKTVGRGGSRGKTSGRGMKGQTARAGHKVRPEYRDTLKRMPKLRGRGKNIFQSPHLPTVSVRIGVLEKHFENGDTVSPKTLVLKGIISTKELKAGKVKIVAGGELSKKLKLFHCSTTKSIADKFETIEDKNSKK